MGNQMTATLAEQLQTPSLGEVFDELPLGILIIDAASLAIVRVNKTYMQFFDEPLRSRDVRGQYIRVLNPSADTLAIIARVISSRQEHVAAEYPYDGFARGRTYWQWVTKPIFDNDGVRFVLITAGDVTAQVLDRQRTSRTLIQEQRVREENRLLYDISRRLSSAATVEEELPRVVAQVGNLVEADTVSVLLWDEQAQGLRIAASTYTDVGYDADYVVPLDVSLNGQAFREGRLLQAGNYADEVAAREDLREIVDNMGVQTLMAVPIITSGTKLGVINVTRRSRVQFSDAVQNVLTLLAEQVGVALTKERLYEATKQQELNLREMLASDERITRTLLEVAQTVVGATSKQGIMARVVGMLPRFIGCDRASITLYDAKENVTSLGAVSGISAEAEQRLREQPNPSVDLNNPFSYRLFVQHQPVILDDPVVLEQTPFNIKSAMFVPMVARGQVLGYVGIDQEATLHTFTVGEQRLMQGVADMIALALENASLQETAARAAALTEASKLKDEFMGIASHELKTPMTAIKGYAQVLKRRVLRDNFDREAVLKVVDVINEQTQRMNRLVDELLDVSRIEAGRLQLNCEATDIEAMLQQLVEQQRMTNEQATISLEVGDGAAGLQVWADENRLQQVVLNLLSNALKYSPDGGEVRVVLRRTSDDCAEVCVSDEGIGIGKEEQQYLFERYFRSEGARQSGIGGLGLGLYIASNIVREHGGRMWVESEEGEGSSFYFTVPMYGQTED